jgi:hypothetical protein
MNDKLQQLRNAYPWPDVRPNMEECWDGWFADATASVLQLAYQAKPRLILESGTWMGFSARAHLQGCPDAHLVCIDTFSGSREHTPQRVVGELALSRRFWPQARVVLDDCNNPAVGDTVETYCRLCRETLVKTADCAWTIEPKG